MSSYQFDSKMARKGSGGTGGRLRETGKYLGIIEWARELKFSSGAVAVEIKFRSVDDQTAEIKIFTSGKDGINDIGLSQLNALMACAKVRAINAIQASVEAFDKDQKANVMQPSLVFPELAGKPIGLMLQKEYYEHEGNLKDQINFYCPFSADTEQTAREILDQKGVVKDVQKIAESLKDKYRKGSQNAQAHTAPTSTPTDFDDDIPF